MHTSRKQRVIRILALNAAIAAVAVSATGLAQVGTVEFGQQAGGRSGRVGIITPPAPATQADEGNTGKPEDPAAAPPRDPGDLMNAGALVYVDDSFASVDKLRTAISSARTGQSQLAIKQFQEITNTFGQKLIYLNDGSYVSATDFVRERLLAMPAIKGGVYDQIFGADAKREIDAAAENRDVAALIRTADRYYPSTAAFKGLCQAAEWYFERGEFTAAAQTWRKAIGHPMVGEQKAQLIFNAGVAESLAQNKHAAQELYDQLDKDFADSTGTISGTETKLLPKLKEILSLPPWEKTDLSPDEWPAFEGGASRSRLLSTTATIGARLWGMPLSNGLGVMVTGSANMEQMQRLAIAQGSGVQAGSIDLGMLNSHPVLSNGMLFIHSGGQVVAMSVNAGAKLWAYPQEASNIDANTLQYLQRNGVYPRYSAHDSAAVYGEQVYAVLPTTNPAQAGGIRYVGNVAMMPTRIVCLNRDDGTQVWSRMASEIKLEKEGSLTFVGSPVVTRQGVFLMARKLDNANFTQQFLVRLDRETGEPTWSCYLCSTNNQLMSGNPAIPVPTLVDDVLYISTGQGADCAVDANAGRILWLRPTITQQPGLVAGGRIMVTTIQPGASWKYNPPVVVGEYVLTTDTGQMLRIYGRWNGRLVKAIPAADLVPSFSGGVTAIDVLAGAIGTKVVMSIGSMSVCYDIASLLEKTPQPFWTSAVAGAGSPQGRPFLTEAGYYVPFSSKLVRIDTRSGKSEQWEWPKNDKDENGKPGNLLVTSEQVIVVNDVEVAGYSKWETARDNRLARIAANPNDPEPYLALAEVAFRTNHAEMAQSNMKKAVDMTNAGGTPASQSNADFLGRLYRTNLSFGLQLFGKSDSALWAQTRFFLEQCRATARQPEQQAEWRMRLANLSLEEKKPEEAIALYTEVLTDPALRASLYRDEKDNQSAGSTAEQRIKSVIAGRGVEVYKRSEDQAAALANRGTAAKDAAVLQQVVDGYPNSAAALSAAMTLADLYQQKQDWKNARRALFWLQPRAQGTAQAKAIADLVAVNIALKKFSTASDFAARGMRMYKDYTWNDGGKPVSFTDLKKKVAALGGAELDGSLPLLHATPGAPELESPKEGPLARKEKELISFLDPIVLDNQVKSLQLLAPVETTPGLRPSNLLFMRNADKLIIRDTAKGVDLKANVALSQNTDTVLLGATRDNAVLLQRDRIIGVDLKSYATWNVALRNVPGGPPPAGGGRAGVVRGGARVMVRPGAQVQVIGGVVVVDGSQVGPVEMVTLIDENGNPYPLNASTDPDQARHAAFAVLGNQLRFTSARMLNGNVYILAGNEMSAYDAKTGKPSWPAATVISGATPVGFLANEDMVLVQADDASGRQSIFYAIDAQSGKLRKTLKLESDAGPEHAIWRGLGDDGTLYVITDRSTAAYDMVTDLAGAIWRKTDIGSRFAGAAALTLDGLIAVNDEHEVTCLSLESGEKRWKAGLKLELIANAGISALRSTVEGDVVVFQSQDGSAAYLTYPSPDPDRQLAWLAAKTQESISRNSLQMSDTLVVELLQGPLPQKTSVGTNIILRDRKGGRLYTDQPVITSRNWAVRSWQVVDGGIAFELLPGNGNVAGGNNVTGNIYLWKSTK